ncbi:MAG: nucleotidyltransferase family protein [Acidobacteria bacterium]|nr:nucleotidyltransferase family protein [Acidobacteriota bacterium]
MKRCTSVFPTPSQEIILEAAVCPPEQFEALWRRVQESLSAEDLDFGTRSLLPLLQPRLKGFAARSMVQLCRADYRRNWLNNQRLAARAVARIRSLDAAGVPTLVLKGAALIPLYYEDPGLRFMSDLDLLVPGECFRRAGELLESLGYAAVEHPLAFFDTRFGHAVALRDPDGHDLDLHCHVLSTCCERGADTAFWEAARPLVLQAANRQVRTLALGSTDQLLHTCVHGMTWVSPPAVRWVADALVILDRSAADLDWARLVDVALQCGVALPVWTALGYLRARFSARVPREALTLLRKAAEDPAEKRLMAFLTAPRKGHPLRAFLHHRHMVERAMRAGEAGGLTMVRRFLLHWCRTGSIGRVPAHILAKGWAGMSHRLGFRDRDG